MMSMLGNIPSLLLAAAILGLLILLHETGHFFFCRLFGIRVEKFSIGFGRELLSIERGGTRYSISMIPFGGFVKPAGEDIGALEGKAPQASDYLGAAVWKRMLVVGAGPGMNFFLAWVLFVAILMIGRPVYMATIGGFMEGYPAISSGLAVGDRVVEVAGKPVSDWTEMTIRINEHGAEDLPLKVLRGGTFIDITVLPKSEADQQFKGKKRTRIGVKPDPHDVIIQKSPLRSALGESALLVYNHSVLTLRAVVGLFIGQVSLQAVSGPVGIVRMAAEASNLGLVYVLQLAAVLSISLGVFNLLPIPALDGGHMLFLLIELVKRSPVSLKFQERSTQVCFILLIALFVVITVNDISRLPLIGKIKTYISQSATP